MISQKEIEDIISPLPFQRYAIQPHSRWYVVCDKLTQREIKLDLDNWYDNPDRIVRMLNFEYMQYINELYSYLMEGIAQSLNRFSETNIAHMKPIFMGLSYFSY